MQAMVQHIRQAASEQGTLESIPAAPPRERIPDGMRKRWKNCIGNEIVEPLLYAKPQSLAELVATVKYAQRNKLKVKAIGSGHSFSDIVQTPDVLVNTHGLKGAIPLDESLLHDESVLKKLDFDTRHLVHVENGIRIRDLNEHLDANGLALHNMGGYDAQTIAGVVATSTHGTGITLGPIAANVVSIIMVGELGTVYRIERSNGITSRQRYEEKFPDNRLIQDDDDFNAVLVSMGCMGIVYSFILNVTDAFFLEEKRIGAKGERNWEELRDSGDIETLLHESRHFEVWVNPYAIDRKHDCLVTRRNPCPDPSTLRPDYRRRNWAIENILLKLTFLPTVIFRLLHKRTPKLIRGGMNLLLDYSGFAAKSYKVMNLGNANNVKGYAAEYAVSLRDGLYLKAVDKILELAEKNRELGQIYHTAPISLRFVKRCDAFLSMMNGEDKCLIEVPLVWWTKGRFQILDKIEHEFLKMGAIRPHWGQYHNLGKETIERLYPDLPKWLAVYERMNSTGIFSNTFTDRCGFDKPRQTPEVFKTSGV